MPKQFLITDITDEDPKTDGDPKVFKEITDRAKRTFSITDTNPEKEQRRIDEINLLKKKIFEYQKRINQLEKEEKRKKEIEEYRKHLETFEFENLDAEIKKIFDSPSRSGGKLQKKKQLKLPKKATTKAKKTTKATKKSIK
jgi:hypothetical protein